MKVIDPSVPRHRFWSDDVGGKEVCPKCGQALVNEQQTYVMVVRQGENLAPFIVGGKGGFFCTECPSVVLDRGIFEEFARVGKKNTEPGQFTVLGLLDLTAIPPERRSQPWGADGSPMPLVRFIKDAGVGSPGIRKEKAKKKPGQKSRKRK